MFKRHYELAKELKLFENTAINELSTEEIGYYLELRKEHEELKNQLISLLPLTVERLKELMNQSKNELEEVFITLEGFFKREPGEIALSGELIETLGKLESDLEKVTQGCSLLYQFMEQNIRDQDGLEELKTGKVYPLTGTDNQEEKIGESKAALEEAACTAELPENPPQQKPPGSKNADKEAGVSPETIKKIESIVRPKATAGDFFPSAEKQPDDLVKKAVVPDSKIKPAKGTPTKR